MNINKFDVLALSNNKKIVVLDNAFIGAFVGKNRSSIKREIDNNVIEIWDINSTKSPYKEKKQINIKYYL